MRRMLIVAFCATMLAAIACRHPDYSKTPEVYGFDSCTDPRITRTQRLTITESPEIAERIASRENRIESVDEGLALFAHASVSSGFVYSDPKSVADHTPIDTFVRGTDFGRDELFIVNESITGSDGYAGIFSQNGRTGIVAHQCGAMGGAVPPTAHWIGVYRVPRGNVVSDVGCEPCPVFVCCPP